jgi:hypothetical protein
VEVSWSLVRGPGQTPAAGRSSGVDIRMAGTRQLVARTNPESALNSSRAP